MIELKKEFKKSGNRHFKQLLKNDSLVIYEVSQPWVEGDGVSKWFEIFKPLLRKKDLYHDEDYEAYPSDEEFGIRAWCCSNIASLKKVLSHPTRGYFKMSEDETNAIIAQIIVCCG